MERTADFTERSSDVNASEYFKSGNNANVFNRICTPAYERMKYLYALGNNNTQIVEILSQEFSDIDYNPISARVVKEIINQNKPEFERYRMEIGMLCEEDAKRALASMYRIVQDAEIDQVDVFTYQWKTARDELRTLDLSEVDDDGNFKNTSRIFVLIELCDKLQSKVAKIVGTDAIREIEIFRQKAAAKAEMEQNKGNLLPQAKGQTIESTNFI
jgi:hypothetical protein